MNRRDPHIAITQARQAVQLEIPHVPKADFR